MREVVKRIALTSRAPIQVDSTEPDVIAGRARADPRPRDRQLDQPRGRARQARRGRAAGQGARRRADRADDRRGRAWRKTAERKLEVAKRIEELACDEHGLDREALIFDALTFTLTTGDEEWRPSAVETIEGIQPIKAELPGVKTSLGVSNVSFGVSPAARAVLNSVFLHHCVEAGLDLAMVNPNHITPYVEIADERARARRRPRLQPPRGRARALHRPLRAEGRGGREEDGGRPDRGHGARGGAPLPHPAPQEGGRGGLDRPLASRRSARSRRSTRCCCPP